MLSHGTARKKPEWIDQQIYDRLPTSMEVRVRVRQPGFRVESFVAVTTLTDATRYAKDEIASLCHCRWLAETGPRNARHQRASSNNAAALTIGCASTDSKGPS